MTKKKLNYFLEYMINMDASDLHLKSEDYPRIRKNQKIKKISNEIISRDELIPLAKEILKERFDKLAKEKDIDCIYHFNNDYRFRVNIFFQVEGISFVFRKIPLNIPKIKNLKLPEKMLDLVKLNKGLVLITGATGNGKSTTLASLIDYINENKEKHIITIEDPIEFLHKSKKSLVNQRTIGHDALNFFKALRSALREDPDIILVGEMRDKETISTALRAAETGHLVLSTLHTSNATETITRILNMFSEDESRQIKLGLINNLKYVVSQQLITDKNEKLIPIIEFMFVNKRIQEAIIKDKIYEIPDIIEKSSLVYKMNSFDQNLINKILANQIDFETAIRYTNNPNDFIIKYKQAKITYCKKNNIQYNDNDDNNIITIKESI